jgi:molybdate transport system substrate-binding protein
MTRNILHTILSITVVLFILIPGSSVEVSAGEKITLRIMAAASLTEIFDCLKEEFEEDNKDVELEINYAGSQALYNQLVAGVEAAIFASANIKYMNKLQEEGLIAESDIFAHNKLLVAVKKARTDINSLLDLLRDNVTLAIADQVVPVGSYTYEMLRKVSQSKDYPEDFQSRFLKNVVCFELNVKDVVARVVMGEVDAGICYQTDINRNNRNEVKVIDIDDSLNITASYPIGILNYLDETKQQAAKRFLDFLKSKKGKELLELYGFET